MVRAATHRRGHTAWSLLRRLGAVEGKPADTLGVQMRHLPLQPRLARMFLAGDGSWHVARAVAMLSEGVPARGRGQPPEARTCWPLSTSGNAATARSLRRSAQAAKENGARPPDQRLMRGFSACRPWRASPCASPSAARRRHRDSSWPQETARCCPATAAGHNAEFIVALEVGASAHDWQTDATIRGRPARSIATGSSQRRRALEPG